MSAETPIAPRRARRLFEPMAWVAGIALSALLANTVYQVAGQPFITSLGDPLALPKELVVTSRNANIPLPPELTPDEREEAEEARAEATQAQLASSNQPDRDRLGSSSGPVTTDAPSVNPPATLSPSAVAPQAPSQNRPSSSAPSTQAPRQPSSTTRAPTTQAPAPSTTQPAPSTENNESGGIIGVLDRLIGGGN